MKSMAHVKLILREVRLSQQCESGLNVNEQRALSSSLLEPWQPLHPGGYHGDTGSASRSLLSLIRTGFRKKEPKETQATVHRKQDVHSSLGVATAVAVLL